MESAAITVMAEGLAYPEGPVALGDGSVLVCELLGEVISRISPAGVRTVVAQTGGSPNGAAIGPDGNLYVCNSGGFDYLRFQPNQLPAPGTSAPGALPGPGIYVATTQPAHYVGGSIQKVDLVTGTVTTLYTTFPDFFDPSVSRTLRGPDDLVFDNAGGFWFTDFGKARVRDRDVPGVYYATADGSRIEEKIFPMNAPNGVALSPDGTRLYVAETYTRAVWSYEVIAPGTLKTLADGKTPAPTLVTAKLEGVGILDSMKVDAEGNLYVVTMLPKGNELDVGGGLTVVSPDGQVLTYLALDAAGVPDPLPSNLCFGGPDMRTAFITLGGTGRLVSRRMYVPGLRLNYTDATPRA